MWRAWMEKIVHHALTFPIIKEFIHYPTWTPVQILNAIIAFTWAVYIWETYLSYRQHSIMKKTKTVPYNLAGVVDQPTFNKSRLYQLDKSTFSLISSFYDQLLTTAILVFGGIPYFWGVSGEIIARFGYGREYEITQTLVFCFLVSVISQLMDLPWNLYSTFVIEERHGFNKETLGFFLKDKTKKFIVTNIVALPILACLVEIVRIGGDNFFFFLWLFCVIVSLFLLTIYPDFIAPLFDQYSPLQEGELKDNIESLAKSIDFPLKKIFVVAGSKRSAHSNAYLYGFYKNKRVVLYDTLIAGYPRVTEDKAEAKEKSTEAESEEKLPEGESKEKSSKEESETPKETGCNTDEILAVLAHEFGHWKLNHFLKNVIIAQFNMFLTFAVFALLYKNSSLYEAFGFRDQQPIIIGFLAIFQFVFQPYHEVLNFLMTVLSRRFEFQADAFAKVMHRVADLRSALIKLNRDNLSFPVHDWLYSAWHHSHPPLLQRLNALGKVD